MIKNKESYFCIKCKSKDLKWFSFKLRLCNSCKSKRMRKKIGYDSKKSEYKRRFGGLREIIIKRDGESCIMCGITRNQHRAEFKKDLTVDHIDKQGRYAEKPNNDPKNLQTLCLRCHGAKDAIRHGRNSVYLANLNRERFGVTD